ncbi:alpha-amylase C-terminal beta-sheet domain-containing protein [Methylobacterium nodulans]|uniref:Alpha amylase catalytic region n=1 Tax=Methylobacterium nodulans (strain LMG 21967 / CNCM I-2342 / ORS 2060) TaxID=460265 RepID=B8I9J3_METNO|nr:alpha-amylase C-terminal beta-sheet domain-containing protein [Methylobacterium nodulans]ACL55246.1 alpha amylase catalytic region [Methylobacterium nodulans ORS 2060]
MRCRSILIAFIAMLPVALALPRAAHGQAGFDDDRVLLQSFYWESYRHGHPVKFPAYGNKRWYRIVAELAPAIRAGRFDLIWLPSPSFSGAHAACMPRECLHSAGYNPKEYFDLDNSYGDAAEHASMLTNLLGNGVEPVADLVLNHRDGSQSWGDFRNPDWGPWAITRDDEAFTNPASPLFNLPVPQRGAPEEKPVEYARHGGTTYAYGSFRDLDHTNEQVRRDIIRYLLQLKSLGYRGWRYDMVHGYHARWIAVYNRASAPTFSVGEYDWDKPDEQRGWVWFTAAVPGRLETSSSVFDFMTQFYLKDHKGDSVAQYGTGRGLVGDTTDGQPWKNKAVTFLENHDTGYRTNEDGTPENSHTADSFANGWEVEQGYARILTHPGVPAVYWKHYFDWGPDLSAKIRALINARKVAGVHAGSAVHPQDNARSANVYAARVEGRNGDLYVRIGGSDTDWQPSRSGYRDYREYARGAGWTVWVGLSGNPAFQEAPLRAPLPIPIYRDPQTIDVPDRLLN